MRKIYAIAAFAALSIAAAAQNGNHTVEVTNDYVSQLSGLQKTGLEMAVPDSLLHFDYKFDYSVFETPYKGAYEFSPYHIHVQPQASVYDAGKFYLRAGAGYSIRPVLEFTAAAVTKPGFDLDIYNVGSGFYGRYAGNAIQYGNESAFTGYDAADRLGLDARWIRPKFETKLGLSYDLIAAGDAMKSLNSMTHSGSATLSVAPLASTGFDYRFGASARFTSDSELNASKSTEALASLDGMIGFGVGGSKVLVDFALKADMFKNPDAGLDNNIGLFSVTPSYNFNKGAFAIKAGARIDYSTDGGISFAPDVRVSANLLQDRLSFYAGAGGGQTINDHFSLKSSFHRAIDIFSAPGLSRERYNVYGGFDGHAGHTFEWGLRAGYRNWKSLACENLLGFGYASVSMLYLDGRFAVKSERIDFDGDFRVSNATMLETADVLLAPSFSGNVRLMYNQNKRFFAGVWAQGQTARKGMWMEQETSLPGWVNLGISAEYKVGSKWGVWVEAGNLLCQELWLNPVCAEKDPYATLGICLKF